MAKKRKSTKSSKKKFSLFKKKSRRGRKKRSAELKLNISPKVMRSIGGMFFYLLAIISTFSFTRQGILLESFYQLLVVSLGWGAIAMPFIFVFAGSMLINPSWKISRSSLLMGSIIGLLSMISLTRSGRFGHEFWLNTSALLGIAAYPLFLSGVLISILVIYDLSLLEFLKIIMKNFAFLKKIGKKDVNIPDLLTDNGSQKQWISNLGSDPNKNKQKQTKVKHKEQSVQDKSLQSEVNNKHLSTKEINIKTEDGEKIWHYPPLSFLKTSNSSSINAGDIKHNAAKIEATLQSFGVFAKVREKNVGPTVTQYAIELAVGTKLSKVTSLANDLALALAAKTGQIRIEAPIPGKSLVGIELPNLTPTNVPLGNLFAKTPQLSSRNNKSKLLVGLGLDISGQPVSIDLAKLPHLLIAGATGSGKSVCMSVILSSILMRANPSEVKLILIDPKIVGFSDYNGIPHLLTPVINKPDQIVSALKWVIVEMEQRYKLFAEAGVKDIANYNQMAGFQAMPYIVVVIDELADIMLFAPSEVEDSITRIAQKARAAGIHLVLATQRPSVDVITGLIKANVPARIAFNVSSMTDSRVILDTPGAEKLLGKGDMLYISPDQSKPVRIQGAFVSDQEIKSITGFLRNNGIPVQYTEEVTTKYQGKTIKSGGVVKGGDDDLDKLFADAVRIICEYDKASASLLQRRLSIGYNRAARILDQLHAKGVVSAAKGSKPREVLIKSADEFLAQQQTS